MTEDDLVPVLNTYLQSNAARTVALNLISSIKTVERLLVEGAVDSNAKSGLLRLLAGMFLDMPANPFWRENAGYITPIVGIAINAWMDAPAQAARIKGDLSDEASAEAAVRMTGLRSALAEIGLAILYCEQGPGPLRDKGFAFRNELIRVLEK